MDFSPATDLQWDRLRAAGRALCWPHAYVLVYALVVSGRHPETLTVPQMDRVLDALADLKRVVG